MTLLPDTLLRKVHCSKTLWRIHLLPGLSAAMLLRYSLNLDKEADAVETAVQAVLKEGYRTGDIMSEGCTQVGTVQMGDLIAERIH